ncbi:hypothetical protein IAR55_002738 [Kwoniella newhampshirensis]|uniref:CBF1-interacting co-repressor CIR N-terminal domain-containing protein n=1 Tax=Kwoniella newhampshirensis TaxID=1651941 RepID=A0AAW0YSL3_9TREE
MGGGDLNMKKSWHPVLLVNQERVWKAEKAANEEKKALSQLRKEREEERQLLELQRLQEATTGKKRVEKLDWMYAAPGSEGGALGGQKIGEREMEEYLLGKKRVDEVLSRGDKDVGAASREFIALQNANSARDTAAKIREDPLLAIKKQEQAALAALMNRPDIRKQLKAAKKAKEGGDTKEDKEEKRARKKAEKEEKRKAKHDSKYRQSHSRSHRDSRSPRSDYSDERHRRDSSRRRRDSFDSKDERRRRDYHRDGSRSRSVSPKRERDYRRHDASPRRSYRDDSPRRRREEGRDRYRGDRERDDPRIPPPRQYPTGNVHDSRDVKPHPSRPSAMDLADRPTSTSQYQSRPPPPAPAANGNGNSSTLEEQRAARLAAMSASANQLYEERSKTLAQRAEEERREAEREQKMRAKYGQEQASAGFFKEQSGLGLSETLARRAGKGLLKDI